jgi:mannose-6-phosphate isomerase-like protein (cupin superfamily)
VDPIVSGPGEGERLTSEHRLMLVKAVRPELDVLEYDADTEYEGAGAHYHARHADSFYVLEGELAFVVAGTPVRARAGSFVLVPPGVVHEFTNPGPGRVRLLNIHAPDADFVDLMRAHDRGENVAGADYDVFEVDENAGDGSAVVSGPDEGERFERADRTLLVKAEEPQLSLIEMRLEPTWAGIPPHEHDDHVDSFYVVEGEIEIVVGADTVRATAGTLMTAPQGARHGINGTGLDGARLLNIHTPDAGFVEWVRSVN